MSFKALSDRDLQRLTDDQLLAYIRDARSAGEAAAARRGLAILVSGYMSNVRRRVRLGIPPQAVEDVAQEAIVRAIAAAFSGSSRGEFRSWLHTIVDRTVADWYRRAKRRPPESALAVAHGQEDETWVAEPSTDGEADAVLMRVLVEELLGELSEEHRRVVELHVLCALPAAEVCERIDGMSAANVAQIASRFRARLRARLDPDHRTAT